MSNQKQIQRVAVVLELCTESPGMVMFNRPQDFRVKKARWQYWTGEVQVLAANNQPAVYEVHAYARRWKGQGREFRELNHDEHPTEHEIEALVIHMASTMRGFPIGVDHEDPVAWNDPLQEDDFLDEEDNVEDFDFMAEADEETIFDEALAAALRQVDQEAGPQQPWWSPPRPVAADEPPTESGEAWQMPDLGSCCACQKHDDTVRNIVSLPKRAPVPGTGWGCAACRTPADGALAVVCDACLESNAEIKEACKGFAASKERIPVEQLVGDFGHDMTKHGQG